MPVFWTGEHLCACAECFSSPPLSMLPCNQNSGTGLPSKMEFGELSFYQLSIIYRHYQASCPDVGVVCSQQPWCWVDIGGWNALRFPQNKCHLLTADFAFGFLIVHDATMAPGGLHHLPDWFRKNLLEYMQLKKWEIQHTCWIHLAEDTKYNGLMGGGQNAGFPSCCSPHFHKDHHCIWISSFCICGTAEKDKDPVVQGNTGLIEIWPQVDHPVLWMAE